MRVESHAQIAALCDAATFETKLQASHVLIRLDERGRYDDPVPWVFGKSALAPTIKWKVGDEETSDDDHPAPGAATLSEVVAPHVIPAARGAATVYTLDFASSNNWIIGRNQAATLRIDERCISRVHARIFRDDATVFLEDLGSTTGCRRNLQKLESKVPQACRCGDIISLGEVELLLLDAATYYARMDELSD